MLDDVVILTDDKNQLPINYRMKPKICLMLSNCDSYIISFSILFLLPLHSFLISQNIQISTSVYRNSRKYRLRQDNADGDACQALPMGAAL